MTKFNPENKEELTYGECLHPAMKITDQEDANQYKADYIKYQEKFLINGKNESGHTAEQIVNANIAYFTGYYDNETAIRVKKLFNCQHPIFK